MNAGFDEILRADAQTRSGLFTATAQRLGTTPQNVEKDFWVCWTLDALFNGLAEGPRLLFKGGTSPSKAFGLIERFSEDIDVTVFRDDRLRLRRGGDRSRGLAARPHIRP